MSLFGRKTERKSVGQILQGFSIRLLPGSRHNYAAEIGDGTHSAVSMAPIMWVARVFPEMPVQLLYDREEIVEEHPMLDILNEPNPHYSWPVMSMGLIISLLADGNAYLLKRRSGDGRGVLRELWYVPHLQIEPVRDSQDEYITAYRYTGRFGSMRIAPEDVVHLRYGIDPENTLKGISPIKILAREIATDDHAANYSAAMLRNLGVPGLIITPKSGEVVDPNDMIDVKKYIKEKFSGDGAGEPFATSLPVDLEPFGIDPVKMNLKAMRAMPETRVCALLGIPAQVVGLSAGQEQRTYANYGEARQAAYEDCIIPMQRLVAADLRNQLLSEWEPDITRWKVNFDLHDVRVLQDDENAKYQRVNMVWMSGLITDEKARAMLGIREDDMSGEYRNPMAGLGFAARKARKEREYDPEEVTPEQRGLTDYIETLHQHQMVMEKRFARELARRLLAFGKDIESIYLELVDNDGNLKDVTPDDIIVESIMDRLTNRNPLMLAEQYVRVGRDTFELVNAYFGLGTMLENAAEQRLLQTGGRRAGLIDFDKATRRELFRVLSAGRAEGLGSAALGVSIRSQVPGGRLSVDARAELIARTETKYAQNVSTLQHYEASDTIREVLVFDDQIGHSEVDHDHTECADRNGRVVTFAEAELMKDLEHPNGTLSFAPVFDDGEE